MSLRSFCAALARWSWALVPPAVTAFLTIALPKPGPWFDEVATVSATSRGWGQLWLLTQHQDVPLLGFYAIVKTVSDFTGADALTAGRGVSAVACVLSSALTATCAHRLWGRRAGLIAGLAIALLPSTMGAAVNARPEATSVLLVSAYFYAACRGHRVSQVLFGLLAALVYALNVLYLPLALLVPGLTRRKTDRGDLLSTATATALGLGWLMRCYEEAKQVSWISTNASNDLLNCFIRVGFTTPLSHHHELPALICSVTLAVLCLLYVLTTTRSVQADSKSTSRGTILRLLALWLAPPLVMTAAVLAGIDVFVERYFTPSTIGIALLLGFCSTQMHHRHLGRCLAAGSVALSVMPIVSAHAPDGHWGENLWVHQRVLTHADPTTVSFAAPRNRAVLFASGRLDGRWQEAAWWRTAKETGSLWGLVAPTPGANQEFLVIDAKRMPSGASVVSRDHRFVVLSAKP